jgi:predicted Fe-Mo cluster-binding NifX family protein
MENPNIALGGGAVIQSVQFMANKGVSVVPTENCGPNAFQTFGAAGIQVITGVTGQVRKVVERFKAGELSPTSGPSAQSHFGMGRGMGGGMGRGRSWPAAGFPINPGPGLHPEKKRLPISENRRTKCGSKSNRSNQDSEKLRINRE